MNGLFSRIQLRLRHAAAACKNFVSKIGSAVFGHISWNPPLWLSRATRVSSGFIDRRPWLTTITLLSVFFVSCAGAWTLQWYQRQPKPHRVSVQIAALPVTPLEKELKFPPLRLTFSDPAASLEDLKKTSVQGVRLEPSMRGTWRWLDDRTLTFKPDEDWPAAKKVRVVFDKNFFPRHVLMEKLVYETQTPAFAIIAKELQLYQDPTNPGQHQITVTFELTHAIDPGELDRHIQLVTLGGSNIFPSSDPSPHFTLTYGLHRRFAYLRSSAVTLPDKEDFLKVVLSKGVRTAFHSDLWLASALRLSAQLSSDPAGQGRLLESRS